VAVHRRLRPVLGSTLLALAACVGTLRDNEGGGPPPDAAADDADARAELSCDPLAAPSGDGRHNPGASCLTAGCHAPGSPGPTFTAAGTLYATVAGGATVAGATIHLVGASGTDVPIVTADNGNFYTTQPIDFPASTYATLCPDVRPMVTPVDEAATDCNAAGCHADGFRIALP
jgi:hypothetical protein